MLSKFEQENSDKYRNIFIHWLKRQKKEKRFKDPQQDKGFSAGSWYCLSFFLKK